MSRGREHRGAGPSPQPAWGCLEMALEATAEIIGVLHRAWGERCEQVYPTSTPHGHLPGVCPVISHQWALGRWNLKSPVHIWVLKRNPTRTWIRTQVRIQVRIQDTYSDEDTGKALGEDLDEGLRGDPDENLDEDPDEDPDGNAALV